MEKLKRVHYFPSKSYDSNVSSLILKMILNHTFLPRSQKHRYMWQWGEEEREHWEQWEGPFLTGTKLVCTFWPFVGSSVFVAPLQPFSHSFLFSSLCPILYIIPSSTSREYRQGQSDRENDALSAYPVKHYAKRIHMWTHLIWQ